MHQPLGLVKSTISLVSISIFLVFVAFQARLPVRIAVGKAAGFTSGFTSIAQQSDGHAGLWSTTDASIVFPDFGYEGPVSVFVVAYAWRDETQIYTSTVSVNRRAVGIVDRANWRTWRFPLYDPEFLSTDDLVVGFHSEVGLPGDAAEALKGIAIESVEITPLVQTSKSAGEWISLVAVPPKGILALIALSVTALYLLSLLVQLRQKWAFYVGVALGVCSAITLALTRIAVAPRLVSIWLVALECVFLIVVFVPSASTSPSGSGRSEPSHRRAARPSLRSAILSVARNIVAQRAQSGTTEQSAQRGRHVSLALAALKARGTIRRGDLLVISMISLAVLGIGFYALLIWLDTPPPTGLSSLLRALGWDLPESSLLNDLPGLRGWGSYPTGWSWPSLEPAPLERWLLLVAVGCIGASYCYLLRRRKLLALMWIAITSYVGQVAALWLRAPNPQQLLFDRVLNPEFTGYFTCATRISDGGVLFGGFARALAGNPPGVLTGHCVTHPPGPILYYWAILQATSSLPDTLQRALANALSSLLQLNVPAQMTPAGTLTALIGGNSMLLGAALIVFPLYGLASRLSCGRHQLPLAALGSLVPGILLMSPEFDQVNATASAVLFYLTLRGLEVERRNMLWGLTGGIVYGFAIYGSYGLWVLALPVAAIVLKELFEGFGIDRVRGQANRSKRVLSFAFMFCVTSAGIWLGLWLIGQLNVPELLRLVRAFLHDFDEGRASAPWLILNLTDFAQFAGIPLTLTIFAVIYRPVRQGGAESVHSMRWLNWVNRWSTGVSFYAVLFGAFILAVDAMGVVRGESGRIWMFMVPLGLMAVYHGVGRGLLGARALAVLLACQFIVCVVIAGRWTMP